jgi:hypothetical protein
VIFHCNLIDKAEVIVNRIQDNLKAMKSCQESYADKTEGLEKATRGGGGEWEPIKILNGNLPYIPEQTQHAFLLTQLRPHSYWKAIVLRTRLGPLNQSGSTTGCMQNMSKTTMSQNQTNKDSHSLMDISSNTLWV